MPITIDAMYNGKVFLPLTPPPIKPDTRVRISVVIDDEKTDSFIDVAQSLKLDGPPDWSENLDTYLYGRKDTDND